MNRRSPALWLSVACACLTVPGIADGAVLPGMSGATPGGDVAVPVPGEVQKAADLGAVREPGRGSATAETEASVDATGNAAGTGLSAGTDLGARGTASPQGVRPRPSGGARAPGLERGRAGSGQAIAARRGRAAHAKRRVDSRNRSGASSHPPAKAREDATSTGFSEPPSVAPEGHSGPLRAVGREVGNPVQLTLAAWLLVITGAGILGTSRLVRRLQRSRF